MGCCKMRVGILTFHRSYNCGALLQAWALRKVIERLGFSVEFPLANRKDRGSLAESAKGFSLRIFLSAVKNFVRYNHRKFRAKYIPERDCAPEGFSQIYDAVVVGSDQVWNNVISGSDFGLYLGENFDGVKKIGYAISCGDSLSTMKANARSVYERMMAAVGRFDAVSCREECAARLLSVDCGKKVSEVLDPTLLLEMDEYDEIVKDWPRRRYGEYLFVYSPISSDKRMIHLAQRLARELSVKCIIATPDPRDAIFDSCVLKHYISPLEFVRDVRDAKYVMAVSFHGTALSLIFRKRFVTLRFKANDFESRPGSLLKKVGGLDRLVDINMSIDEIKNRLLAPDVDYIGRLNPLRDESLLWLKSALIKNSSPSQM